MAQYVPQQPFVPNVTPQEALRNPPQFGMPTPQMHNDLKGRLSEEGIVRRYPDTPTYSGGLGVSSRGAGALSGESNSDLCKPLLRKYQITGVTKWRSRYNGCLRGNFSGLDHLDE